MSESNVEVISGTTQTQLKSIIDRLENLDTEVSEVREQIKEVLSEASNTGFDKKILKKIIRLRKKSKADRQNEEAITTLYLEALGES